MGPVTLYLLIAATARLARWLIVPLMALVVAPLAIAAPQWYRRHGKRAIRTHNAGESAARSD